MAASAETRLKPSAKPRYLINLVATIPETQDPRRKELIAHTLDDLSVLSSLEKEPS